MGTDSAEMRRLISPLFEDAKEGPFSVYLYGSRATGFDGPDSDYDFAVIGSVPLDRAALESLRERLIEMLPGDAGVDCVDLRQIPLTLAAQVLESGLVLIAGDEAERARVETRLMSMYASLNEERREIVADIVERGSVYAR